MRLDGPSCDEDSARSVEGIGYVSSHACCLYLWWMVDDSELAQRPMFFPDLQGREGAKGPAYTIRARLAEPRPDDIPAPGTYHSPGRSGAGAPAYTMALRPEVGRR